MARFESLLVCVVLSACATDVVTTGGDAQPAPDAMAASIPVGLYHLPMKVDAINLELRADNTFRWSLSGCDVFGGDGGKVSIESDTELVLLPAEGKTMFQWIGAVAATYVPELRLEVTADKLIDSAYRQGWVPGGVCSVCGGNLGPTGQEPCDEPTFYDP